MSQNCTLNSTSGYFVCDCKNGVKDFDDIKVVLKDGMAITMKAKNYVFSDSSTKKCSLLLDKWSSNYVMLGDSFLRDNYIIHDLDNKKIGIASGELSKP